MSHKPDPVDVLHAALLTSKLKIAGAARSIGRSPGVMYNKFSDTMPDNEITAREALALSLSIKSTAYAEAVATYFDGVFIQMPEGEAGDDDVLAAYLNIVERMGSLSSELTRARSDGVIDQDEFKRLVKDGYATMAAIKTLLSEIETMVHDIPESESESQTVRLRKVGGLNG